MSEVAQYSITLPVIRFMTFCLEILS